MKSRLLAAGLFTILLPFGAVACGADSTGELDKGDLTDELVDAGMTEDQAPPPARAAQGPSPEGKGKGPGQWPGPFRVPNGRRPWSPPAGVRCCRSGRTGGCSCPGCRRGWRGGA